MGSSNSMIRREQRSIVGSDDGRKLARAHRYVQAGDTARALLVFREILNAGDSPVVVPASVGAGNAYLAMTRYSLAESHFEQALESGASGDLRAEALQNLGIARYVRGDRFGACEAMIELAALGHPVFSPLADDNLQVLFGLTVQ